MTDDATPPTDDERPASPAPDDAATDRAVPDGDQPEGAVPDGDLPDGFTVPDDLSSFTGTADAVTVAIVVTQVAAAEPLAAACALAKVAVDVVPSPVGALAVLRDPTAASAGAAAISQLLKAVPVVLLERRTEKITATRWANGVRGDELPSGLVLSDAPQVLDDLLLGGAAVADLDGVVTSVGMSRWKAMRALASSARPRRP